MRALVLALAFLIAPAEAKNLKGSLHSSGIKVKKGGVKVKGKVKAKAKKL